jgi:retron-type reverse transcriptase
MKRAKHLWAEITSFENVYGAAYRAIKGKRWKPSVMEFAFDFEKNIIEIRRDLIGKQYVFGVYKEFDIYEPKRRRISAAPFRDRVVHHALCAVIEPVFDPTFVSSYANRKGYGTHRALRAFSAMYAGRSFALKCDIRKFFPSIDHEILKRLIRAKIACRDTLALIDAVIDNSNPQEPMNEYFGGDTLFTPFERRRGIPIGNLTSQFFANIYLNPLDHFVKETLRCRDYVRYVDDFVLFHDSRNRLEGWREDIERFLEAYRLRVHPVKTQIASTRCGVGFLGFRFLPHTIRVCNANKRRGLKRLNRSISAVTEGSMEPEELHESVRSWCAHLSFGNTVQLRKVISERMRPVNAGCANVVQRAEYH